MENIFAALFDLDGVIIDTEPQYDMFWEKTGEDYHLGIENLEQKVKGTILPEIMVKYFSHLPAKEQENIIKANQDFDLQLEMLPIPGVLEFISELKKHQFKLGLVTSSNDKKLEVVFKKMPLGSYFDTVVSADRITHGKPHPMCYLLAAKDLEVNPGNCFVFEDSFHGIEAGNSAEMKVIGLSTTNSAESIQSRVARVIPDFQTFEINDLLSLSEILKK